MESVAPPLRLLLEVTRAIDNGESIRSGIINYLKSEPDSWAPCVAQWFTWIEQRKNISELMMKVKSPYRRRLLDTLKYGLEGNAILSRLRDLESEIIEKCNDEIEQHIQLLPFRLLIPLLLFQFPAFLILLIGPLVSELVKNLGEL